MKNEYIFIKSGDKLEPYSIEDTSLISMLNDGDKVKVKKITKKRSLQQNRALHLFFIMVSDNLNDLGITFVYRGLKGQEIETPYTEILVKETLWKPIQKTLFDIESTTELDTEKINKILDILVNFFAEKGISISFPSRFDLLIEQLEKEGY